MCISRSIWPALAKYRPAHYRHCSGTFVDRASFRLPWPACEYVMLQVASMLFCTGVFRMRSYAIMLYGRNVCVRVCVRCRLRACMCSQFGPKVALATSLVGALGCCSPCFVALSGCHPSRGGGGVAFGSSIAGNCGCIGTCCCCCASLWI